MGLRDDIKNDQNAMDEAQRVLEVLQNFTADQWQRLIAAIEKDDKTAAAEVFGLKVEQMDDAFKLFKERARAIATAHPDILDMTKRAS